MKSYMIFRVYSKKERPNVNINERSVFYGWTTSKAVVEGFLAQRNNKKYRVVKMSNKEIASYFSEDHRDDNTRIDLLVLHRASNNEKVTLFTTVDETAQAEKQIQRMFYDAASFVHENDYMRKKGSIDSIELFINLKEEYIDLLRIIGFEPPELESLFTPEEYYDSGTGISQIENEIEDAYSGALAYPLEEDERRLYKPLGLETLNKPYSKMLYSLEAFIKVLKEEL